VNGIYVHEALAQILLKGAEQIDSILIEVMEKYRAECIERGVTGIEEEDLEFFLKEQQFLLEGLVRGWVKTRLPRILEEYEVVEVEKECKWELAPNLIQMLRVDALLRRKVDGVIFILEFKTTSFPGYDWQQQWEHNIQLLSYTGAVTDIYGEPCGGVLIEGLVKGTRKNETAASSPFNGRKLQQSPFCYLYRGVTQDGGYLYETGWKKGWTKVATFEEFDSVTTLMGVLDDYTIENQFIAMPPICPLQEEVWRWRRQVTAAETRFVLNLQEVQKSVAWILEAEGNEDDARMVEEDLLDQYFPQHDNACRKYGSACKFLELCFNPGVAEDPLGSGLFQIRVPHHSTENETE
jgi:hypothetical protein